MLTAQRTHDLHQLELRYAAQVELNQNRRHHELMELVADIYEAAVRPSGAPGAR